MGRSSVRGFLNHVLINRAIAKFGAFYRLDKSTAVSSEYPTIVDFMGGSSAVQTDADRVVAAATSSTNQPVMEFDGTDIVTIPLSSANNSTTIWGPVFWFKPGSFAAGQALHYVTSPGLSGSADVARHRLNIFSSGKINLDIFVSGLNGRSYTATSATLVVGTFTHIRVAFNSSKTNECDTDGATSDAKVRIFLDGVPIALTAANIGVGGTVSSLLSATGSALIGGANDSDTPTVPILNGGQIGPYFAIANAEITEEEGRALVGFMSPK